MVTEIHSYQTNNYNAVVSTIARAFCNDPMFVHVMSDNAKRPKVVTAMTRLAVNAITRVGKVDCTADTTGTAMWMTPAQAEPTFGDMLRGGLIALPFRAGFRPTIRFLQMLSAGEAVHREATPGPHWYLAMIAVEPEHHGQGIGSALIQHGLKRVDADGLPCYLETSNERNIPLYERYGFNIYHTDLLPDNGPRYWGMLRETVS